MEKRVKKEVYEKYPYPNLVGELVDGVLYILFYVENYISRSIKRVLDVGCGTGEYMMGAAFRHPEVEFVGVDFSEKSIEIADKWKRKKKLQNVSFYCQDIRDFELGKFDYVVCSGVIEEGSDVEILNHIVKVMKEDGMIGLTFRAKCGVGEDIELMKNMIDILTQNSEGSIEGLERKVEILKRVWYKVDDKHWLKHLISRKLIESNSHLINLFVSNNFDVKSIFNMLSSVDLKFIRFVDEHVWLPEFYMSDYDLGQLKCEEKYSLLSMLRRNISDFEFFASPILRDKDWRKDKLVLTPFGALVESDIFVFYDGTTIKLDLKRVMILKCLKQPHTLNELIMEIREISPEVITEFVRVMFRHKVLI